MPDQPRGERVAVIAVHGVADQPAGHTAAALAELLVAAPAPAGLEYVLHRSEELALHVESMPPSPQARAGEHTLSSAEHPTPEGPRPLAKAFSQSYGSDFNRHHWVASGQPAEQAAGHAPGSGGLQSPGIELSDFLLFKACRNGTPPQAYRTTRLDLQRRQVGGAAAGGPPLDVHVYEMYWADLSRLSGGVPRILTEFFTMVFRLSQLGRDTVRVAARQFNTEAQPSARWRWLRTWQTGLDWAFSKGLALLTLQLLMAALVIIPMGLALQVPGFAPQARDALAIALPLAALLAYLYRFRKTPLSLLLAAAVMGGLAWGLRQPPAPWVVGIAWLVLLSLAYDAFMRVCDARFPFTRVVGWSLWAAVLACILATAVLTTAAPDSRLNAPLDLHVWVMGALRALELVLLANIAWWGLAGVALLVWFALGHAAARTHGFEGRTSVATGRLGLFASMGMFVVLTMAAWAALNTPLKLSVPATQYQPLIFGTADDNGKFQVEAAASFLQARYLNSTETFSLVAMLMVVLVIHLVLTFVPSVLAETGLARGNPSRLGRWLTFGYRYLDFVVLVIVALGVLAAVATGALLVAGRLDPGLLARLNQNLEWMPELSQRILKPLIFSAASAMVAISVLGRLLSRYVPWLRAPLDIALDVDNHFREFPRRGIPRARIFSRYFALLRHVAQQRYDRVVIVSHSQGTVISTELLRYLKHRGDRAAAAHDRVDHVAAVWTALAGRVQLLTAGSPLRQLYASRFPTLYRWVLCEQDGRMGPLAAELGVQRWINAYTTGDYIGRWLWSRPARPPQDVSDPQVDEVREPDDVYRPAAAAPAPGPWPAAQRELDVCLGSGAHTHYFEPDQHLMAGLVDRLIADPAPQPAVQAPGPPPPVPAAAPRAAPAGAGAVSAPAGPAQRSG
jgi:hypothetical protein